MSERLQGIDLGSTDKAKDAIRYNAEHDLNWKHHELATRLYGWTDIFRDRLIEPVVLPGQDGKLPAPLIGFEKLGSKTIAYYRLGHNPHGIEDEVILNEDYLDRPLYSVLESVLHEQLHLWQQRRGKDPIKRNYHNKEFCEKAWNCGLRVFPIYGFHYDQAGDPFESLLREYGIPKPPDVIEVEKGEKRNYWEGERKEGRSTLSKWACPCGQIVRVGRKELHAQCTLCGEPFELVNGKAKQVTVYEAKK